METGMDTNVWEMLEGTPPVAEGLNSIIGEIFATAICRKRSAETTSALQQELVHVTRMVMMGGLAATLAHELARPLAAILSNAQAAHRFLTMDTPQLGEVQEALDDMI